MRNVGQEIGSRINSRLEIGNDRVSRNKIVLPNVGKFVERVIAEQVGDQTFYVGELRARGVRGAWGLALAYFIDENDCYRQLWFRPTAKKSEADVIKTSEKSRVIAIPRLLAELQAPQPPTPDLAAEAKQVNLALPPIEFPTTSYPLSV